MNTLYDNFCTVLSSLVTSDDKVLLGVSGGVDSMVLLRLFAEQKALSVGVAHCNFGLRGAEADRETDLVERTCAQLAIPCHTIHFDTKHECSLTGESTQMAARRLRYDFFEQLCQQHNYTKVAIAHHSDDSTETIFINMIRGTGLRGITGISQTNGRIIRPLLFARRDNINAYAAEHDVPYLNDSSNDWQGYLRNRLRHDILPRLSTSSNNFPETMAANIARWEQAQNFIDTQILRIKTEVLHDNTINLQLLGQHGELDFLLFELLYPYGFSPEVIDDLCQSVKVGHSGKRFVCERFTALLDRMQVILTPRQAQVFQSDTLESTDPRVEWLTTDDFDTLLTPTNVALLSADALTFPLQVRTWQQGDSFIPLGMHGFKKVSDYLIDCKIPLTDKQQQGVLLSGQTIIWLIGRRIDDRYKVTERTKKVVRITL